MFVDAIKKASEFTRPIYIISRNFGSTNIIPGSATLFLINDEGYALTCAHVVRELVAIDKVNSKYQKFKAEIASLKGKQKKRRNEREIEMKNGYDKTKTIQAKSMFVGYADGNPTYNFLIHPNYDLAIIKAENFNNISCNSFPVFPSDTSELKQGKMLCRLGFPFPEFSNFTYNLSTDNIDWTTTGRQSTPRFPIEGMLTRYLKGAGNRIGFEMSTPGLRGQSGGPAFDSEGKVWGMQAATAHLDLNFDVDQEVIRQGQKTQRKDSAFLHVGHCIHVDILKEFMREHNVNFIEG